MVKGIENIPFFLYYMYGQKHPAKDSTAVYLIKTADGYFDHKVLSNREQEILMNPVLYYSNLKQNGDGSFQNVKNRFGRIAGEATIAYLEKQLCNDQSSIQRFPGWWGRYFSSITGNKYDSVSVVKSYVSSQPPYQKRETDSLIFTVKLR